MPTYQCLFPHTVYISLCVYDILQPAGRSACSLGDAVKTPAPDVILGFDPPPPPLPLSQEGWRMNSCWLIVWLCKRIPYFLLGLLVPDSSSSRKSWINHLCLCGACVYACVHSLLKLLSFNSWTFYMFTQCDFSVLLLSVLECEDEFL